MTKLLQKVMEFKMPKFPKLSKTASVVLAVVAVSLLVAGPAIAVYVISLSNSGTINATPNLAITKDGNTLTSINWGARDPDTVASYSFDLRNTGNVPVTLSMNTTAMSPANFATVTWNREGASLAPGATVTCTVIMTISEQAPAGPFSYTINISGA